MRLAGLPDGSISRAWLLRFAVGIGLFISIQIASIFIYSGGVPANIAGFPLPFLSTIESPETGTELLFSPEAMIVDFIIWISIGTIVIWIWKR